VPGGDVDHAAQVGFGSVRVGGQQDHGDQAHDDGHQHPHQRPRRGEVVDLAQEVRAGHAGGEDAPLEVGEGVVFGGLGHSVTGKKRPAYTAGGR
jgi:hypothetical protein